jgi:hypothetical protein
VVSTTISPRSVGIAGWASAAVVSRFSNGVVALSSSASSSISSTSSSTTSGGFTTLGLPIAMMRIT